MEQAQASLENLQSGRLVEIPGNHMTMLFGAGARVIVEAITTFLSDSRQEQARA
jgi:hypothetical protein